MSQFGMPMSKRKDGLAHTQIHGENIILMILKPKIKVIQRSWMYVTHHPMVIHSCAKLGMTISKDKKAVPWTWSHVFSNPSAPSGVDGNSKGPPSGSVSSYLRVRPLIFRSLRTVCLHVPLAGLCFIFPVVSSKEKTLAVIGHEQGIASFFFGCMICNCHQVILCTSWQYVLLTIICYFLAMKILNIYLKVKVMKRSILVNW